MHLVALPGAVQRLLAVVDWLDFHIVVYSTASKQVVICNDGQLWQIIPVDATSCHIHPKTGALCLTSGEKLMFYEPQVVYAVSASWRFVYETKFDGMALKQAQWLSEGLILVSTNTQLLLWSQRDMEQINKLDLEVEHIQVSQFGSGEVIAWDPSDHRVVLFNNFGAKHSDFSVINLEKYLPKYAYFVSSDLIVVETQNGPTFVYNHTRLVFTIPKRCAAYFPNVEESNGVRVEIPGDGVFNVTFSDTLLEASVVKIRDTCEVPQSAETLLTTSSRIFVWNEKTVDIYTTEGNGKHIATLSGLDVSGKDNSSNCLAVSPELLLLGSCVLNHEFELSKSKSLLPIVPKLACFLKQGLCVIDAENQLLWLDSEFRTKFKVKLGEESPILLKSIKQVKPCVVFANGDMHVYSNGVLETQKSFGNIDGASVGIDGELVTFSNKEVQFHPVDGVDIRFDLDDKVVDVALSTRGWILVAYATSIQLLSTRDPNFRGPKFELPSNESIKMVLWDENGDMAGVLSNSGLHLYDLVSILRGTLDKMATIEEPFKFVGEEARFAWCSPGNSVIIFDGQQVWHNQGTAVPKDSRLELPIYHPWCLTLLAQALNVNAVKLVCLKLGSTLKFSTPSDDGQYTIDPQLGIKDLEVRADISLDSEALHKQLSKCQSISNLSSSELQQLLKFVECTAEIDRLDALAFSSLVLSRVFKRDVESWIYAFYSQTKLELQSATSKEEWHVWLDTEHLKEEVEKRAKSLFATSRDPTLVTIYYLALNKLPVLQTLWRISSGHPEQAKTLKLLQNDFKTERWQSAALKNAYALLSKHRDAYAAAFFLLGNSPVDCCELCVSKLKDAELAFAVARVYGQQYKEIISALLARFEDSKEMWLSAWCCVLMGGKGLDEILGSSIDPSAVVAYMLFNTEREKAKDTLTESGLSTLLADAVCRIEPLKDLNVDVQETFETPEEPEPKPTPKNLKPPPAEIQLEPDMSAFGF